MATSSPLRRIETLLILAALLLVLLGVGLMVTGAGNYLGGNLILFGGLCLVVGITGYLIREKHHRPVRR